MRAFVLALAIVASGAEARTLIYEGIVAAQENPGDDPFVALGDKLTIRFGYDPATQPRAIDANLTDDPEVLLFGPGFSAFTNRGLAWTFGDEYLDQGVLLKDGQEPAFSALLIPTNTASRPILRVSQSGFSIEPGDGFYGNQTPSLGFSGDLRLSFAGNPVPEPATWALMLAGFGMLGLMGRRQRQRRVQPSRRLS